MKGGTMPDLPKVSNLSEEIPSGDPLVNYISERLSRG